MKKGMLCVWACMLLLTACAASQNEPSATETDTTAAQEQTSETETETEAETETANETETEGNTASADTSPGMNKIGATQGDMIDVSEYEKLYLYYRDRAPEYVYSAEEWTKTGKLDFPFDVRERTDLKFYPEQARYFVPDEALHAAPTIELLDLMMRWPYLYVGGYQYAAEQIYMISSQFNVADEFFCRADRAQALLEMYCSVEFYSREDVENGVLSAEAAYDYADGVELVEILLARNDTFELLSEEERKRCLDEVLRKYDMIDTGNYYTSSEDSFFFFYLREVYAYGKTEWYDPDYYVTLLQGEEPVESKWYDYFVMVLHDEEFERYWQDFIDNHFCPFVLPWKE